jgi:hypothetical protein
MVPFSGFSAELKGPDFGAQTFVSVKVVPQKLLGFFSLCSCAVWLAFNCLFHFPKIRWQTLLLACHRMSPGRACAIRPFDGLRVVDRNFAR